MRAWMFSSLASSGSPLKSLGEGSAQRLEHGVDGNLVVAHAGDGGHGARVFEADVGVVRRGQHHRAHALAVRARRPRWQASARSRCRRTGRSARWQSGSCRRSRARRCTGRRRRAAPAAASSAPRTAFGVAPANSTSATTSRHAGSCWARLAAAVDDERGAVEDQLVLAADAIDVDDRAVPFPAPAPSTTLAPQRLLARCDRASRWERR